MKSFLFVTLLVVTTTSFSQILIKPGDAEDSKAVLDRQLLVKLYEVDEKILAKLDENEKADYKKWVSEYNELVQISFKKYWPLHANPQFLTIAQIEEIVLKEQGDKYAMFSYSPFESNAPESKSDAKTIPYSYHIYLTKKGKPKSTNEIQFVVKERAETEMDYKFVLYNLAKYLKAESEGKKYKDPSLYDKTKNFETLTKKTLLFDREMLDSTALSIEKATSLYPHKIKFSTSGEIYQAVENSDPNAVFMTYILNETFNLWMHAIVDASTMDILAMQSPARVHFIIGRRGDSMVSANQKAAKYGGSAYSYRQPMTIWQFRVKLQLNEKDFKYLGSQRVVDANYANPMGRY